MKTKVEGISILVSMGTSMLVLTLAFATLNSISRSLDQASNIQRSTQLFFASESGAEAAFFHHNARGAGLSFTTAHASQALNHSSINADTNWTIEGRSTASDSAINPTDGNATVVDILREGQTLQIPLRWDESANPLEDPPQVDTNQYDQPDNDLDHVQITFYRDPAHITASSALDAFNAKYNFSSGVYPIDNAFDFGDNSGTNNSVLIDWSFTRKHSRSGVQTFIPTNNQDCSGFAGNEGYICEQDLRGDAGTGLGFTTNDPSLTGKILPGSIDTDLDYFWDCSDSSPTILPGDSCSDYQITIRPLLQLNDTLSGAKVPGIPYELKLTTSAGVVPLTFPQRTYNVTSDVVLEDFSQRINIEIAEKTSIGAFDYVIFD